MRTSSIIRRIVFAAFALCLLPLTSAHATTFVVTSTADTIAADGAVTFREAFTAANTNAPAGDAPAGAPGLDTITFNIPGSGAQTIQLVSALPIISDPLVIDGFSQPGSAPGAPLIELRGGASTFSALEISTNGGGSTIRGLVITFFRTIAIQIRSSSGNTIAGNFLGVDATGTAIAFNPAIISTGIGLAAYTAPANNNTIGGLTAADRNVVAAGGNAIDIAEAGAAVTGTRVLGNRLNTNAAGTAFVGSSSSYSLSITGTTGTLIGGAVGTTPGGACTGSCNLLGGALTVFGPGGDLLTIAGNDFGTDVTGRQVLPGAPDFATGIDVAVGSGSFAGSILIGGTTQNARNVIGGSGGAINVSRPAATQRITIVGNYIGVDTTGTTALPSSVAVGILQATGAIIGGTTAADRNVISGATATNLSISNSSNCLVQGNIIGPAADGVTSLPGIATAFDVLLDASTGAFGATTSGGAGRNVVAYGTVGVALSGSSTRYSLLSNSIFGHSRIAVDLGADNASRNDDCDSDAGPNLMQNFPDIASVLSSAGNTTVTGTLNSVPNTAYTLEFFSDISGTSPQARTYLGSQVVTTNASCAASFSFLTSVLPPGTFITATATDPAGNTSELSRPQLVRLPAPSVSTSFGASPLFANLTSSPLTITITNPNSLAITGLALEDQYARAVINAATPAVVSTCGGVVSANAGGSSLVLSGGSIAANGSCTITVMVTATTPGTFTNVIAAGAVTSANALPNATASATATLVALAVTGAPMTPGALALLALALVTLGLITLRRS